MSLHSKVLRATSSCIKCCRKTNLQQQTAASGCLWVAESGGAQETFGGDGCVRYLDCGNVSQCLHESKLVKEGPLNMGGLLHSSGQPGQRAAAGNHQGAQGG